MLRDLAAGKVKIGPDIVLAVIPVFNIGGMLNRGSFSRANQNGPGAYGFRGNARNLDLNRDFIKMDARETRSLVGLFHRLDPDLFIDNHVSNGADYQHVMTLLSTQKDKFAFGAYLENELEPAIYAGMKKKGYDLVPYVNHWGHTPDSGWQQFYEGPRFASGFTTLFGSFGFVPETHMLKPYASRVKATYELMTTFIALPAVKGGEIRRMRTQAMSVPADHILRWRADTVQFRWIPFKGYEARYEPSEVSGQPRLFYDRKRPYTKQVKFFNHYLPAVCIHAGSHVFPLGLLIIQP
ncbi:MAG: hypothetical protein EOP49_51680, partial [Sphingobacteriales bacterium]